MPALPWFFECFSNILVLIETVSTDALPRFSFIVQFFLDQYPSQSLFQSQSYAYRISLTRFMLACSLKPGFLDDVLHTCFSEFLNICFRKTTSTDVPYKSIVDVYVSSLLCIKLPSQEFSVLYSFSIFNVLLS